MHSFFSDLIFIDINQSTIVWEWYLFLITNTWDLTTTLTRPLYLNYFKKYIDTVKQWDFLEPCLKD